MKKTLITLSAAAAMGFGSLAMAGPVMMSDAQLDTVVAGKVYQIWLNQSGDDYIINGNKNLAAGERAGKNSGNGTNYGWGSWVATCDTETSCTSGTLTEEETFEGSGVYEWVYNPGS